MLDYKLFINNGNEAFGTTGKTLSIEEKPKTVSVDFIADAIHSQNELISKRLAAEVLAIFGEVAARMMAEGLALQFQNDGKAILRLYADMKIKGGNINLSRARELTGNPALTEEEMVQRAGEIVSLAGVQLRAYAETEQKFNEMLKSYNPQPHLVATQERAYVQKKDGEQGGNAGGSTGGNGGTTNPPAGGGSENEDGE